MGLKLKATDEFEQEIEYWKVGWFEYVNDTIRFRLDGYKNKKASKKVKKASISKWYTSPLDKKDLKWNNLYIHAKKQEFFQTAIDVLEESE